MNFTHTSTVKGIKELYSDSSSCIKKVSANYTLLLHPAHIKNIKIGIRNELNSMLKVYIKEFKGILLGYENLKVSSPTGWLFETNPYLHINIKADFYIFSPEIGDVLEGTVVKKSKNAIGCLVHNIFNASSTIPHKLVQDQWCGSRVTEGDTVQMKITKLDLVSFVPYIRGEIVPDSVSKRYPGLHGHQPGPQHIVFTDEDSGISSIDKSYDDENPVNKKKKKTSQDIDFLAIRSVEDQQQVEAKEGEGGYPRKKKKKSERGAIDGKVETVMKKEMPSFEEPQLTDGLNFPLKEEPQSEVESSPKKKKKKKSEEKDVDPTFSPSIEKNIKRGPSHEESKIGKHKRKKDLSL